MKKNLQKEYIVIPQSGLEFLIIILRGWIKNIKLIVTTTGLLPKATSIFNHLFFIRKYIKESVYEHKVVLGDYKGIWYDINKETIDLTLKFYEHNTPNVNKVIKYYNRVLNTNKFGAFVKDRFSKEIFALLQGLHIIRLSGLADKKILMAKTPIAELVIRYMKSSYSVNYKISWFLPIFSYLSLYAYCLWLFTEFIRRGVVFNKSKRNYKVAAEASRGFYLKSVRDDILIDGNIFNKTDLLLLQFETGDYNRTEAFKEAKARGFDTACVNDLRININKDFLNFIFFYFLLPVKTYIQLLLRSQPYFCTYVFLFHQFCFPMEVLLNLFSINCYLSNKDYGDAASTIILNKYGAKNIVFIWSDVTVYKAYTQAFIAHNVYFGWGDIYCNYHSSTYYVDKAISIGCIFKEEYNKAVLKKEDILRKIDKFRYGRKIVTFYDTSFSNLMEYTEGFFLEYLEMINTFSKINKDVNILLKPKNSANYLAQLGKENNRNCYVKIWDELTSRGGFYCLNPLRWNIEETIAISDLGVSMAMNSASTISLICGKNALYFDKTGNSQHPFAKKYKNKIVFEDEGLLFQQIDNILNGKFDCKDVVSETDIREYDGFYDDKALIRLRNSINRLILSAS